MNPTDTMKHTDPIDRKDAAHAIRAAYEDGTRLHDYLTGGRGENFTPEDYGAALCQRLAWWGPEPYEYLPVPAMNDPTPPGWQDAHDCLAEMVERAYKLGVAQLAVSFSTRFGTSRLDVLAVKRRGDAAVAAMCKTPTDWGNLQKPLFVAAWADLDAAITDAHLTTAAHTKRTLRVKARGSVLKLLPRQQSENPVPI